MAGDDLPTTVGVHIGGNEDRQETVREFDAAVKPTVSGPYSRSDELLRSMQWRILIEDMFARHGLADLDARAKEGTLRQALADHLREVGDE